MAIFLGFKKPDDRRYLDKDNYLPKSGGTMTGNINLSGNDITGLPNVPPTNSSAISKEYIFLNYVRDPAALNVNINKSIVNLKNFVIPTAAVNKKYVHEGRRNIIW